MRILHRTMRAVTVAIALLLLGCFFGTRDVTDDPALADTGWVKGRTYELQKSAFIYRGGRSAELLLNIPDPANNVVVPSSVEEFQRRRKEFNDGSIGILEKHSRIRLLAIYRVSGFPEYDDYLVPVGEILDGQFHGKRVDIGLVSKIEPPVGSDEYVKTHKPGEAIVLRRNPAVFMPVGQGAAR